MYENHNIIGSVSKHTIFVVVIVAFVILAPTTTNAKHSNDNQQSSLMNNDNDEPLSRTRRTAFLGESRFYQFGIIPYTFHRGVSQTQKVIIQQVIEHIQDLTCIRFVPRVSRSGQRAKDVYNLGHNGFVQFVEERNCFGGEGNNGRKTLVSCCDRTQCLHEIGHALGLLHEQLNPGREGFVRVNYQSIPQAQKIRYMAVVKEALVPGHPFDLSSPMSYTMRLSFTDTLSLLTQDLSVEKKDFYMFQELSANYRCSENNCTNFDTECENDGYVTMISGTCACRCPNGLNPNTGCSTTLSEERSDESCGGVFDLTNDNSEQTFIKPINQDQSCTWLIKAPEGDTIYTDFNEFHLPKRRRDCSDSIDIKHGRIGAAGKKFCGTTAPKYIRSYYNNMMITYTPGSGQRIASKFNFTVRLIRANDLCYNVTDKGRTYGGTVNYARDYTPCIDWWKASDCPYNPYNLKDLTTPLGGNYCRNPGNGLRPWCYVNEYGCQRKYCDVCHVDTAYNTKTDRYCDGLNSMYNYCVIDPDMTRKFCAKRCKNEVLPDQPSVSTITCQRPASLGDDSEILNASVDRNQFAVGESVTFRCMHRNRMSRTEIKTECLSNGNWSYVGNTACLPCHFLEGFTLHNGNCYKILTTKKTASRHQRDCGAWGGNLADVTSQDEQEFITSLGFETGAYSLYIGANDLFQEGTFRFRNMHQAYWTPWNRMSRNRDDKDCVWSNPANQWVHGRCNVKRAAVCKVPKLRHSRRGGQTCRDSRNDCDQLLQTDPEMCDRNNGDFAFTHCTQTCNKCF